MSRRKDLLKGLLHGIPIALGYFSVSFGFGIKAVGAGLSVLEACIISLTNLTSAGQVAGVDVIAGHGTLIEMAVVQAVINIRYSLMALSLSQKLDSSFTTPHRFIAAHGITDEIFAVCYTSEGKLRPFYMYGVAIISAAGWIGGTFLGGWLGEILPSAVTAALGILLYGMFIAIVVPEAKKHTSILFVAVTAAALSCVCRYCIPMLSHGFAVIISALAASLLAAAIMPGRGEEKE